MKNDDDGSQDCFRPFIAHEICLEKIAGYNLIHFHCYAKNKKHNKKPWSLKQRFSLFSIFLKITDLTLFCGLFAVVSVQFYLNEKNFVTVANEQLAKLRVDTATCFVPNVSIF